MLYRYVSATTHADASLSRRIYACGEESSHTQIRRGFVPVFDGSMTVGSHLNESIWYWYDGEATMIS